MLTNNKIKQNVPKLWKIVIRLKYFNPFGKLNFDFLITIQKYESFTWDIIIDPVPIDKIIIDNSNKSNPKLFTIGNNIELTIIIDEVLEPWEVLISELHKKLIMHT